MSGVHPVLNQFDDGYNQVGGVIPVEEVVDVGFVLLLHAPVYLFAERRKDDNRTFGQLLFRFRREIPHFVASGAIHHQDQIVRIVQKR